MVTPEMILPPFHLVSLALPDLPMGARVLIVLVTVAGLFLLGSTAARALLRRVLSPGAAVILLLAIAASVGVALIQPKPPVGLPFWVFSDVHYKVYSSVAAEWTRRHSEHPVHVLQLTNPAIERRMLSGFLAGTPVADIIAAERPVAAKAFVGPLEDVGFVDITERLRNQGLLEQILPNSLTPWTTRGRIFGLPLDVHPVLLAYRSDLVEAAGIDVSGIETWEDYFRLLRPLQQDFDDDGRPDRWLLNLWDTSGDLVLMLLDQAGGGLFDAHDRPQLNNPRNAEILAQIVTWVAGPGRVCADVDLFSASGHRQRLDGVVVGALMPDWMCGLWKQEIPGLAGKVKLMPLPAWERGGKRTSVWRGGTMLGISKRSTDPEGAWGFARHLALSTELAADLYRATGILPPNRALWSLPVFDEPDPYFSGQPVGRIFLSVADDVPVRSSSPFAMAAQSYLGNALVNLRAWADASGTYEVPPLRAEAQRLLDEAQRHLVREIGRNTFLTEAP